MDDDILTIEEVAKYLRVSERTVYDWAQKGEIPAGKIGTVWRFKKSEIERWVNERLSSNKPVASIHPVRMRNVLSPDRVVFMDYSRKRDALVALAERLAAAPQIKSKQEIVSEILRREDLMSTAIGRGIAIPHVRLSSVTDLVVAVGVSKVDIQDFNAFDDAPVRLLFMIAAAYNQHAYYLQTLSYFSAKLKNNELREAILAAPDSASVYDLLVKQDED
ncbi:MAG: helix-turn-helix domain-containing protein [Spirochaetales bacterium]|nr:MAG: helix-turn-helix domain-containing protein [Spirochaetales bacterium]